MTLRSKASIFISLIIIIVMGAFGIYYLQFMQRSLKQSIFAGIQGTSDATSQAISKFLADSLKETQAVALALRVEALEKKDTPVIRDQLKSLLNIFPKFENGMFILDKDGFLWVDYPQFGVIGANVSYREYFQRTLKEGKGIIGVPYVSSRTGKPVLTFTALLRGSKNQVLGVLGCSVQLLSPDALGGIREVKIGRSGYVFVFDASRLMILHPEDKRVLKRDIPLGANKLLDAAIKGFEGVGETVNSRGVPMLTAFKRIPGTDWIIGAQQPQEEAYLPIGKARDGLILSIILMVVVAVVSVAMAIRRITRPLTKLRQAVMFWGKGKSAESEKVAKELEKIRGSDEIGTLAKAFVDISKQLDETLISLKNANNDWERTFDAVTDLIAIIDNQHTIVKINQAMADRLRINAQDVVGLKCYNLFHGTGEPLEICPHQKLLEDGQEHIGELVEKALGGTFLITASPLRNQAGELIGSVQVSKDITERKLAEEALWDHLFLMQTLLDTIPTPIFYKNIQGIYLGCNKALTDFLGLPKEELIGKSVYDVYSKDLADKYSEMDAALFRQLGIQIYDFSMDRADGTRRYINFHKATYSTADGTLAGLVGVMIDITERKRAEEALLDSEQKLANIIDFLPDATFVIDTKGKVIAWNKAIEEMTGVKAKDMVGKGNYEYALPFYGERRPILIDLVLESKNEIEKYDEVKREDRALAAVVHFNNFRGKESYLFGKASALIDLHGNMIGSIESIRDITALRKTETNRLQFSKLESLGTMAGGIAHDFNNILTAILGNIGLALLDGKKEPKVQDRLVQAEQACWRAQALSQQLLTFAKGGAPIKKIVSIANLLKESAILSLSGSKSRCEMSIPGDLWPMEADEGQINQVIGNLLINAAQAMSEGGIIKIKAENILVEAKSNLPISKGKYVKLAIADQGVGISQKYLDKIFDPYFSTKQKGSGLGLATAYSIIKNHSGHIQVESQLGVGTTFYIYLPTIEKGVTDAEPETAKPTMGQGKVLIMDDEEMVREVLGEMLSRLGYEADFAIDGSQSIDKFVKAKEANQPFAAVILDLTIPGGMGGKEAIKELLKIAPQVKAIVSSGYSDDPIMADFQKYGFAGVIAKPYRVSELGKVLNKALTGKQ